MKDELKALRDMHAQNVREMERARRRAEPWHARVGAPIAGVIAGTALALALIVFLANPGRVDRAIAMDIEEDKARLSCRQSGGTYEYFRSQGYHCIGARP